MWRPGGVTPLNDCIQKSSIKIQSWLKSKWSRIQWHSNEKINVLVWTNGVSWTILDDWRHKVYEGWASFGKSLHLVWSNGNLMKKLRMNIQQGWRHHADLPLPGVQNSHPSLSNIWQPQGVHGGRTRDVNKSNSVYRQSIIVSSESWRYTLCDSLSPG